MSTSLNDGGPLLATHFSGANGQERVQVTLIGVQTSLVLGLAPGAYLDVPLDDFKHWLADVSAALERIEAKGPVPAHGAGGEGEG
jgi:hypothetical protein